MAQILKELYSEKFNQVIYEKMRQGGGNAVAVSPRVGAPVADTLSVEAGDAARRDGHEGDLVLKGTRTKTEQVSVYQFMLANQVDHSVVAMSRVRRSCRSQGLLWGVSGDGGAAKAGVAAGGVSAGVSADAGGRTGRSHLVE